MQTLAADTSNLSGFDFSTKGSKIDIESITVEHNRRLSQLREQYEEFLQNAELQFFGVLKSIKGNSEANYNEQDNSTPVLYTETSDNLRVSSKTENIELDRISNRNPHSQISDSESGKINQSYHTDGLKGLNMPRLKTGNENVQELKMQNRL